MCGLARGALTHGVAAELDLQHIAGGDGRVGPACVLAVSVTAPDRSAQFHRPAVLLAANGPANTHAGATALARVLVLD